MKSRSLFKDAPDVTPVFLRPRMSMPELIQAMGRTCFEARNLYRGAELLRCMIDEGDTNWLGIAGAGVAGGMGGMVISLLEAGFIDVICSTGAQVYHDLHFAFDLPVKAIGRRHDDDALRMHGDIRIYDIGIREQETLEAQDELIRQFIRDDSEVLSQPALSSWEFNYRLGLWVEKNARHPERSFVAAAARLEVPLFWDSLANHSISMNFLRTDREGHPIHLSAQKDIFDSAAIAFSSQRTGFAMLGGGGPKNFIQQTGPTLQQILSMDYSGAERGIQIGTAVQREGSLSSCTFEEGVTWGKYRSADEEKLVQIWAEYSLIFPLVTAYVLDLCSKRAHKRLVSQIPDFIRNLEKKI